MLNLIGVVYCRNNKIIQGGYLDFRSVCIVILLAPSAVIILLSSVCVTGGLNTGYLLKDMSELRHNGLIKSDLCCCSLI